MAEAMHASERGSATGWGWVLLAGIVLIVGGLVAAVHPIVTSLATAVLLSAALVLGGLFALGAGLANLRDPSAWLYVLLGPLGILAGVIVFFNPFASVLSLIWVIGIWLIVGGVLELAGAFRHRRGRGWLILFGFIDIALGIVLVLMDPFSALFFLAIAVGASFILRGVATVMLAVALRRSAHGEIGPGEPVAA